MLTSCDPAVQLWFDVNRSTFDEDIRENDFYIFVPSDLDLWPLDLKFAPQVTLVQSYVSAKLDVTFLRLFFFEKIGGTGQTDRRRGGGATLNAGRMTTNCRPTLNRLHSSTNSARYIVNSEGVKTVHISQLRPIRHGSTGFHNYDESSWRNPKFDSHHAELLNPSHENMQIWLHGRLPTCLENFISQCVSSLHMSATLHHNRLD